MITNEQLTQAILNLGSELRVLQAETAKQMKETSIELKASKLEVDNQMKETDEQIKETDNQIKKMSKTLENLGIHVDGISKTTGEEAEEFFYSSINKDLNLGGIIFDSSIKNLRVKKQGDTHEIDIFLENGNSVGIIEVKNKVKERHLEQLQTIIDNFYQFHPSFKNYKIIPAIAGKVFPKYIQEKALKSGFVVLTQEGNHIEQKTPNS